MKRVLGVFFQNESGQHSKKQKQQIPPGHLLVPDVILQIFMFLDQNTRRSCRLVSSNFENMYRKVDQVNCGEK